MAERRTLAAVAMAALVSTVSAFEGLRQYAYRDPVGIPTVCFGETWNKGQNRPVQMGDKFTVEECRAMLADRLVEFADGVEKCAPGLPDQRKAAYTSFAYNVGVGAFCKSSIVRLEREGKPEEACRVLQKYVYAGGVQLPGLVRRRQHEMAMCLGGVSDTR